MTTELQEALTAAGAAALVAKQIDPVLLEYQRRYAPLVRALPSEKWDSTVYYFNKRTVNPAGGFVTDGGARPVSTSTYVQENFQMKQLQSVGAVTGYAQAVTSKSIGDIRASEIEGAAKGLYWDIETALLWGAAAPTVNGAAPQFDGLDVICSSFSSSSTGGPGPGVGGGGIDNYGGASTWGAPVFSPWVDSIDQNVIDGGGSYLSYGLMDLSIDLVEQNAAEPIMGDEWMFLASPTAIARLAQLSLINQRFVSTMEISPGLVCDTYKGIPLVKTSFLSARSNVMGTVTATANGTGTLAAQYFYRVAPVIARFGEIQASVESNATPATAGVSLTYTYPSGPEGSSPTHFKVYRSTTTGTETLLGYVDGTFLDSAGVQWNTTKIFDNGTTLIAYNGTNVQASPPATYVYTNSGLKPLSAGNENIYLISRNADNIVRPYVREMRTLDLYPTTSSPDSLPFAFVTDCTLAVRATKWIGRIANVICALDKTAGAGYNPTQAWSPSYVTV